MPKTLIILITFIIYSSKSETNLDCVLRDLSAQVGQKNLEFINDLTNEAKNLELKSPNRISQARKLAQLQDNGNLHNFKVTTEVDKNNQKFFKYNMIFKFPTVNVLKEVFNELEQPENVDSYWLTVYCINGLINIENVGLDIAKLFCLQTVTSEIIGDFKDYKFADATMFINLFTKSFSEYATKYRNNGTVDITLNSLSYKTQTQEELQQKIENNFEKLFQEQSEKIKQDLESFKNLIKENLSKILENVKKSSFKTLIEKYSQKTPVWIHMAHVLFGDVHKFAQKKGPQNTQMILKQLNSNIFQNDNSEQINYWIHHMNYVLKINDMKQSSFFYTNVKDQLMINCMEVLRNLDQNILTSNNFWTSKCELLGSHIMEEIKNVFKNSDSLSILIFTQTFWDLLNNKLKLAMIENHHESDSYMLYPKEKFQTEFDSVLIPFIQEEYEKILQIPLLYEQQIQKESVNMTEKQLTYYRNFLNDTDSLIFLYRYYDYIYVYPEIVMYIVQSLKEQGGANLIVNDMQKYIDFHPSIRQRFQNHISGKTEQVNKYYKQRFLDKILYHFFITFKTKKQFIKDVIMQTFDENLVNFQDFYYFYDVVLDDFKFTLRDIDWERADPEESKPILFKKFKISIQKIQEQLTSLTQLAKDQKDLQNIDQGKFKKMILNVIQKNRNIVTYWTTNPTEDKTNEKKQDVIEKLIDAYNDKHPDNVIPMGNINKKEIKKGLARIANLQTQGLTQQIIDEIKDNITIVIDKYSSLPSNIKKVFEDCKSPNNQDQDHQECQKNSKNCVRQNPALVTDGCNGQTSSSQLHNCEQVCPVNFKQDTKGLCRKPEAYLSIEKNCKKNYQFIQGFCFPVCPHGWNDKGLWCKKPKNIILRKFYHNDFLVTSQ